MRLHCTAGLSTEFPFSDSSILLSPNSSLLLVAHHIAHIQTNKYSTSQHAGTILKYSHTHYILLQYHAVPCRAIQGAGSKSKSRIGRKVFFVKSGNVWNTTPWSAMLLQIHKQQIPLVQHNWPHDNRTKNTLNLQPDQIHFCHWKTRGKLNAMLWVDIFLKKETIKKIIWHTVFRKMFCYLRKAISDGSCSQLSILTKGPLLSSSTGKINSTYLK